MLATPARPGPKRRWPERQAPAEPDRSADLAGTYRSRGGFKLDPERHAETVGAIGQMRETEPSISADMQAVEKENACGGWLEGFDRRIKGDDRLKEKVAEQAAAEPDKSSSAILRKNPRRFALHVLLRVGQLQQGLLRHEDTAGGRRT